VLLVEGVGEGHDLPSLALGGGVKLLRLLRRTASWGRRGELRYEAAAEEEAEAEAAAASLAAEQRVRGRCRQLASMGAFARQFASQAVGEQEEGEEGEEEEEEGKWD
jgi:hypothetical protein